MLLASIRSYAVQRKCWAGSVMCSTPCRSSGIAPRCRLQSPDAWNQSRQEKILTRVHVPLTALLKDAFKDVAVCCGGLLKSW